MFKRRDVDNGCCLRPGYYLLKAEPAGQFAGSTVCFEGVGAADRRTFIPLRRGGTMLLRLRAPASVGIQDLPSTFNGAPALQHLRLYRLVANLIKLSHRSRLKHRLVLLDGSGYICILNGIADKDELSMLGRRAAAQRSLWALGLDDQSISCPEVFDNPLKWLRPAEKLARSPSMGKIGVVLHLYYTDLWDEIAAFLNQIPYPFDLWITHCGMNGDLRANILRLFPQAQIIEVENRGRDIWPFISLLNAGAFDGYGCLCKIHSKKSAHKPGEPESLLGSRWRRRALYDLLAAGRAKEIVDMFERDPRLGLVGPGAFRLPSARYTAKMAWGENLEPTIRLSRRMGVQMGEGDIDFFAGSMFWARPAALEAVRRLNLRRDDFPDEKGQLDGELQHALERLFCYVANVAKFRIEGTHVALQPSCVASGAEVAMSTSWP